MKPIFKKTYFDRSKKQICTENNTNMFLEILEMEKNCFCCKQTAKKLKLMVLELFNSPKLRKLKVCINAFTQDITIRAKHGKRKLYSKSRNVVSVIQMFIGELQSKLAPE